MTREQIEKSAIAAFAKNLCIGEPIPEGYYNVREWIKMLNRTSDSTLKKSLDRMAESGKADKKILNRTSYYKMK